MELVRRKLVVRGAVQGVGYRFACRREAERIGVAGHVRNCPDGTVEVAVEGPQDDVEEMVAWCQRGPGSAHVTGVDESTEPPRGDTGFLVTA